MSGLTAPPILLLLAIASAATAQQVPPCALDLIPCEQYLKSTTTSLASCCGPLKDAIKYQAPCLCGLFNDTSLLKAYGVDLKSAFKLRKLCGISATQASVCGKAAAPPTSAIETGALAAQPFPPNVAGEGNKTSSSKVAVIVGPVLGGILLGTLLYLLWWGLKRKNAKRITIEGFGRFGQPSNIDLPFVDLAIIQAATGKFSDANKLGEGGFGPVYKGTLQGGGEIAVKRLSTKSIQGVSEFKNEVKLIAKLQHRNLARVLGCCIEREEKLLIYEYAPNKSLDSFLFDENKRSQLDWTRRRLIIAGIAGGLLYLHEDSLLKVIHRDLKASNVLLDKAMNPKISDFGMAKIFETDGTAVNTGRVVGTFGYMAPEYAMDGIFSEKSDVYSFGVLLLEIVSGQRNGRSHYEKHGETLLRHAWQLWREDKATELIDELLGDSYPPAEAMRVIHIGLLCVQENVAARPTMSVVVLALRNDQMVLPQPTEPSAFIRRRTLESDLHPSINEELTITDVTPR